MAHNKSISSEEIVVLAIVLDDVFFLAELHRKRGVDLASNPHLRKVLLFAKSILLSNRMKHISCLVRSHMTSTECPLRRFMKNT